MNAEKKHGSHSTCRCKIWAQSRHGVGEIIVRGVNSSGEKEGKGEQSEQCWSTRARILKYRADHA